MASAGSYANHLHFAPVR